MARSINKVTLIGNIGHDPEVRYMPNGNAVTTVSIATTEGWKDKQTGERQERTEWHRVVFFGRLCEIAGEYLRKGSKVYIAGGLRTRKWQDKNGQERYTTEIVANEMLMLDSRGGSPTDDFSKPQQSHAMDEGQSQSQGAPEKATEAATVSDSFDDDIPF